MKGLVIFDIDGTVVRGQSQELFLRYLLKNGKISYFFYFKLLAWFFLYRMGITEDPKGSMTYAYSFLRGVSVSEFTHWVHDFFEKILKHIVYPEAINLIHEHKSMGRTVIFVSNSIEPIVKKLAGYLHVDGYIATILESKDGYYTGIVSDLVYGSRKIEVVNKFVQDNNFNLKAAWTYGDHISDQPLLSIVANPIVVNPSRSLLIEARRRSWPIVAFRKYIEK